MGKLGCDPPLQLLESFLQQIKDTEGQDLDFILIPGDIVAHGVPLEPKDPSAGDYNLLKETITTVSLTFAKYFPNTLIVPTLGNNDPKYHYEGLDLADKDEYFSFLYNAWFNLLPFNSGLKNLSEIKNTMMNGGYYRVDIDSKLTILAINTLYFNTKNDATNQGTEAQDQLDWI